MIGKGISPAQIVKITAGMIEGQKQSDDFHNACRDVLGISKSTVEDDDKRRSRKKKGDEDDEQAPKVRTREVPEEKPEPSDNENKAKRALMKELEDAKAQLSRMTEELELARKKMEEER